MSFVMDLVHKSVLSFESRFKILSTVIGGYNSIFSNETEKQAFRNKSRRKLQEYYKNKIVPVMQKSGMSSSEAKAIVAQILGEDFLYIVRYSGGEVSLDELAKEMEAEISKSTPYAVESFTTPVTGEVLHALDGVTETAHAVVISPLSVKESTEIIARILIMQLNLDEKEWRNDLKYFLKKRKGLLHVEGNNGERIEEFLNWFESNFKEHLPPHEDFPF